MSKTIIISDVHGCLQELKELLVQARHKPDDRVILAGDVVDRGPFSVETVRFAREEGFEVLMGNHEEKLIRYQRHERRKLREPSYKNPMKMTDLRLAEHSAFTAEEHDWFAALPIFIRMNHEGKSWIINHAGIPSNAPPEDQDPKLLVRCRMVDQTTGAYATDEPTWGAPPPPNAVYWAAMWPGPESVVYGHIVQPGFKPRVDFGDGYTCVGIDTGCVFGGALTALVFRAGIPHPDIVSVDAHKTYAKLNSR